MWVHLGQFTFWDLIRSSLRVEVNHSPTYTMMPCSIISTVFFLHPLIPGASVDTKIYECQVPYTNSVEYLHLTYAILADILKHPWINFNA